MTESKRQFKAIGFLILLSISLFFPFIQNNLNVSYEENRDTDFVKTSAQRFVTQQWINNPTFESPIEPTWYWENGTEGDNSDMGATTSPGEANFMVLGENGTFTFSGVPNSTWIETPNYDWGVFPNSDDRHFDVDGCWIEHHWDESVNQTGNTVSVHWKKNITLPKDMTDYKIMSSSLDVIFNASAQIFYGSNGIEVIGDNGSGSPNWCFEIGDYARFYVLIEDLNSVYQPFQLAENRTRDLGRDFPAIGEKTDWSLDQINENLLCTYLEYVLSVNSTSFTMILGIDIFCEDNDANVDSDYWDELRIKSYNLTFTYEKKIDQSTSISWNQKGNKLDGGSVQIDDAKFFFKYKVNNIWPSTAPLSEIRFYINNKTFDEGIIKLTSANTSFQEGKVGGFDVTSLLTTDVNITVSIEVFLKDTFELDQVYNISIDDVYLNISYTETFPDYGTDLELFLDGEDKTLDPVIQIPIKEVLNITVSYKDNVSGNHISADSATLEGKVSGDLTENVTLEHYYIIVNSTELGLGISVLTVTLQKVNYETESIPILVEVIERETQLMLYIDSVQKFDNDTIFSQNGEFLEITINYTDNLTSLHIDGASADLLGFGSMDEGLNQYNYTLNTNNLSQGVNVLTIFAQKNNYQSQTIQFFINVDERATELILFVDGLQKNQSDTIQFEANELVNITIFFRDYLTGSHLSGANVELLGINNLDEIGSQFNITINTKDLAQGINILTIFAQLTNYQPKSIQFFIEVGERATQLQLFINREDKTADPVFELPIGSMINITIKFYDNRTGFGLFNALIQLIGEGLFENLTENLMLNQYTIILNSSTLLLGVKLFSVVTQLPTYQINTIDVRITVDRVSALIDTVSGLNSADIKPLDDFLIQIVLNNTDFGGSIKNATVTYRWDNRQGILLDSDNDGIYEVTLNNVPAGSYRIYINAYAGENYDFIDDFEIILNVIAQPGPDITIIIISLAIGVVGLSLGIVLYQKHFKYPPKVRKIRKLRKKIVKGKKLKPISLQTREEIIKNNLLENKAQISEETTKNLNSVKKENSNKIETEKSNFHEKFESEV
ncbi:MAG: hypothetical protein KGD74_10760 [Candidatus Lokiarchaeota archaeon]|nr:hypothetical protein [Candidatus Lokiarchaeota archaeon]